MARAERTERAGTVARPAPAGTCTVAIVSDIHYAGAAEQARGGSYEFKGIQNPLIRSLLRLYRHFFWMREPLRQGRMLEPFLAAVQGDYLVANGDFSCDSGFVGASDPAAGESIRECLDRLRGKFGPHFRATLGDHELGKVSLLGGQGGMRLESFDYVTHSLGLEPFWKLVLGEYVLIGITSSLVALPVFEADTLAHQRVRWEQLRAVQMDQIREAFSSLRPKQKVLLFCHDPTALPFLWSETQVRRGIMQVERTIIGHLHSNLILWKSRLLAGMPRVSFLGHSAARFSAALSQARVWRRFRILLCPALAGIELFKRGGFLTATLDLKGLKPARFAFTPLRRPSEGKVRERSGPLTIG